MSKEVNILKFHAGSVWEIARSALVSHYICKKESPIPEKSCKWNSIPTSRHIYYKTPEFSCLNQAISINVLGRPFSLSYYTCKVFCILLAL